MGVFICCYRSWWTGELSLDPADQARIADLVSAGLFNEAYSAAVDVLGSEDTLEAFVLPESLDLNLYTFELIFLIGLLDVYADPGIRSGFLHSMLQSLRESEQGLIPSARLPEVSTDLRSIARLGREVIIPKIGEISVSPCLPGRWLLDTGESLDSGSHPYSIFLEAESVVFYPQIWRKGDRWIDAKAVRMKAPFWDRATLSYQDRKTGKVFAMPWLAETYEVLERDYDLDPDGFFISPGSGEAVFPHHPIWQGEAELRLEPALDSFAHTLSELERACEILDDHHGVIHLSW
jgi:hypothetical protein